MICPFCGQANIDGSDQCQDCQEPLDFLSQPRPESEVERSLLSDQVRSLISRRPITVPPDAPVQEVLDLMIERSIGCVVVIELGRVVGIFSEHDVLMRLNVDAERLAGRPVSEFMTSNPETLEADAGIAFALHKMNVGGYRHLPVIWKGRIVGLVSIRDILEYITRHLSPADSVN